MLKKLLPGSFVHTLFLVYLFICGIFSKEKNNSPIIGIFTQPISHHGYYIAASYVKWIESAGGRVVPIPYTSDKKTIELLFSSINGLLLPGGDSKVTSDVAYFVELAMKANDQGNYFPIWGTCLGFEWLLQILSNDKFILKSDYDAWNISMPLEFTSHAQSSQMFGNVPQEWFHKLEKLPLTMNNHHEGILPDIMIKNKKLNDIFHILSTNVDRNHAPFVSSMEAKRYPIYGVQFHPEKNMYEWGKKNGIFFEDINHSMDAIMISQYFANFFVEEARKNTQHAFQNPDIEQKALIYNYVTSGIMDPQFTQVYLFRNNTVFPYWNHQAAQVTQIA